MPCTASRSDSPNNCQFSLPSIKLSNIIRTIAGIRDNGRVWAGKYLTWLSYFEWLTWQVDVAFPNVQQSSGPQYKWVPTLKMPENPPDSPPPTPWLTPVRYPLWSVWKTTSSHANWVLQSCYLWLLPNTGADVSKILDVCSREYAFRGLHKKEHPEETCNWRDCSKCKQYLKHQERLEPIVTISRAIDWTLLHSSQRID